MVRARATQATYANRTVVRAVRQSLTSITLNISGVDEFINTLGRVPKDEIYEVYDALLLNK